MNRDLELPVPPSTELQGRMMHVSRLATIGEMAAGVAHELNQPLTAIANYAQASERLLSNGATPDLEDIREALREIVSQALRAGEIIRRLRNLVRNQEAELVRADINDLIMELTQLLQTDARVHETRLRLELAPDLPQARVDRVQIQHVVLNLMRNALEALADVPVGAREVVISTAALPGDEIEIALCDSGPGVPESVAGRVFDPFVTTKPAGTGLGLAISNTIVRAHQGTLGYRANVPAGVCFYVRIPAVRGEEP